ncbi:hypothetical protein CEXT_627761 [Caerostris extrusa]|uniref:Uncharacterized protein n=1 Tax=Caerostris extrusa TaxID=172846 RepID=A0AAV4XTB1_CAEEX|nr:hypothetical protein CEXT_627761 [Caerostris extrusa]
MQDAAQFRALWISRKRMIVGITNVEKWKVSGDCRNVPRVGTTNETVEIETGRECLTREIWKNSHSNRWQLIREELVKQASGSSVSPNTTRVQILIGSQCIMKPYLT